MKNVEILLLFFIQTNLDLAQYIVFLKKHKNKIYYRDSFWRVQKRQGKSPCRFALQFMLHNHLKRLHTKLFVEAHSALVKAPYVEGDGLASLFSGFGLYVLI